MNPSHSVRRLPALLAALSAAVVLVTACAGNTAGTPTTGATTVPTGTATTATPASPTGDPTPSGSTTDGPTGPTDLPTTDPSTTGVGTPTGSTPVSDPPPSPYPGPPLGKVDGGELVAIAADTQAGPGWRGFSRITDDETLDRYKKSLTISDDYSHAFVDAIDHVPDGKVLVVGVVETSCAIPASAELVTDGSSFLLIPTDFPDEPTPECFAANVTIAAVAVSPDIVGAGTVGPGRQIYFAATESGTDSAAIELTADPGALADVVADVPELAPLTDGLRRFAFVLQGCQESAAAIEIDTERIGARLDVEDPTTITLCDAAVPFLVVFDVPEKLIPEGAAPALR